MASSRPRTLSSDPDFLLSLIGDIEESDSEDEFEGWLGPDDGPTILQNSVTEDYEESPTPLMRRSHSLDSLEMAVALPESRQASPSSPMQVDMTSPSLTPMQSPTLCSTPAPPPSHTSSTASATSTTTLESPTFRVSPGIVPNMDGKGPLDFFRLMFDDHVMELIFMETTRHADQYLQREREHLETHPNARAHDWRKNPLTLKEMEAFIAILIAMGLCGFPTMRYTGI